MNVGSYADISLRRAVHRGPPRRQRTFAYEAISHTKPSSSLGASRSVAKATARRKTAADRRRRPRVVRATLILRTPQWVASRVGVNRRTRVPSRFLGWATVPTFSGVSGRGRSGVGGWCRARCSSCSSRRASGSWRVRASRSRPGRARPTPGIGSWQMR